MKVTLRDIAARAGVSLATVSRVLNDTGEVPISDAIREKVMRVVAETGYGGTLRAKRKGAAGEAVPGARLGYLISDISRKFESPFFSRVLIGVEEEIMRSGALVAFQHPPLYLYPDPGQFQQTLKHAALDGIILVGRPPEPYFSYVRALVPNAVLLNAWERGYDLADMSGVGFDHKSAAETAMKHLVDLGHRCIGFIGDTRTGDRRFIGYQTMVAKAGLTVRDEWVQHGPWTPAGV